MILAEYMKENGFMTKDKEMVLKILRMVMYTRVNIKTTNLMERVHIIGLIMKFMMVNG